LSRLDEEVRAEERLLFLPSEAEEFTLLRVLLGRV
jgi:hypothetical protein